MNRHRCITTIALISQSIRTLGKPSTLQEITEYIGSKMGVSGRTLKNEVKLLLEEYQSFGFFHKEGDRYSLPSELLAIMNDNDRTQPERSVESAQVDNPKESYEVYGYMSNIDHSKSLRHPYLYSFN
ncbi:uncharacterized protein LOC108138168 [Drosophila elegans]|uniref:uncharacterized protein LOC108138168 n=1 Tax=Drosophila elegans TaxID=30023 RepID=UPI0007E85433|nr:uncharacterized protein LOC108138168 [Drosophila elegans]